MLSFEKTQWSSATACPALGPDEVHVWWAALDLPCGHLDRFAATLNEHERRRAARLRYPLHRNRYVAARGWLRLLLGEYLQRLPAAVEFEYGPLGKPALPRAPGSPEICFNASDSQHVGMFAFALQRELGIDVECLPRSVDYDQIAARKFAPLEADALSVLPDTERQAAFLACWTRKEAYGKARGVGIRYPLDSVVLCDHMDEPSRLVHDAPPAHGVAWKLVQLQPNRRVIATVVVAGGGWRLRCLHRPGP